MKRGEEKGWRSAGPRNGYYIRSRRGGGRILRTLKGRKSNWIGHMLRRNRFIKHVIAGNIQGSSDGKTRKKT